MSAAFNPTIVVLAAGLSRRFNGIKVLANVRTETVTTAMLSAMLTKLESTSWPILVATGQYHAKIRSVVKDRTPLFQCTEAHLGMGHTIRQSTEYIEKAFSDVTHIVFILADQVAVTSEDIKYLLDKTRQYPDKITYTKSEVGISAPAVFPKEYWPQLKSLQGDKGAKPVILANIDNAIAINSNNAHIDIDRQEQLIQWNEQTEVIHDHS